MALYRNSVSLAGCWCILSSELAGKATRSRSGNARARVSLGMREDAIFPHSRSAVKSGETIL
jgi:hypothetical protein